LELKNVESAQGLRGRLYGFVGELGRHSAAKLLSKDEARPIAANIAKLPGAALQA
jgi:hypothetical protein